MGPMSFPGMLLAGRYQLESQIAAGAVGEVWRAVDQVLDRPVAVKLLQQGTRATRRRWPGSAPRRGTPGR